MSKDKILKFFKKFFSDKNETAVQEITAYKSREHLINALVPLPKRTADIIKLRYGLNGNSIKTLEEIAIIHNLSRERIRQIITKSIKRIFGAGKSYIRKKEFNHSFSILLLYLQSFIEELEIENNELVFSEEQIKQIIENEFGFYDKLHIDLINQLTSRKIILDKSININIKKLESYNLNEKELILNCVKTFNSSFGRNGIANILKGSKAIKDNSYNNEALNSDFFGALNFESVKNILKIIDELIENNKLVLNKGIYGMPFLSISKNNADKIDITEIIESEEEDMNYIKQADNNQDRSYHENKLLTEWGLNSFYDRQWEVIEKILIGKRVLLIEKTGFGKSLCYQYPAKCFFDEGKGTTIVFSPLIALMRDQIESLNRRGIPVACINSEQDFETNTEILNDALEGKIAILYIAPERQESREWQEYIKKIKLSMVVIDEAHCISSWGHDFRPSFKRIIDIVKLLPKNFPVLAVTATATNQVANDVKYQIGNDLEILRGNLIRENFNLRVINVQSEDEKMLWLSEFLKKQHGTGLIYTGTRANTQIYSDWLNKNSINTINYNAGLDAESRKEIEKGLAENRWKAIISTNALGMGIDKSDIRFIVHTQIPASPVHYYQEIGRAGRDGLPANIILFYSDKDKKLQEYFIENSRPDPAKYYKTIDILKTEPLKMYDLVRKLNLNKNQIAVILADLIEQNIIKKVDSVYEYQYNAPELNIESFIQQKQVKYRELGKMIEYITTDKCRMQYLCSYLEDDNSNSCNNCDNCKKIKINVNLNDLHKQKIKDFFENYSITEQLKINKDKTTDVIASSYYGMSEIGTIIHNCKYENGGDFPDKLIKLALAAFNKHLIDEKFDLIIYVPPTESGDLVKNFAEKISQTLKIQISHDLKKSQKTEPQKIFQSSILKIDNLKDVFYYENPEEIEGKKILIIDDIFDSGVTIKTISKILYELGAIKVNALVIAKTVKGDI